MLLAELGPQAPDVDVDRAGSAVVLVTPHSREQLLTGEHLAGVRGEELQQLVLHVREVERSRGHRRLIGLQIEHQVAVLDDLRPRSSTRSPEEMAKARLQLAGMERRQREVVEEVFAQLQLVELRP